MIVHSVINPLKEKIIFCIDLSIQFSGTRSEAMSSEVFINLSKYVWASLAYFLDLKNMTQTLCLLGNHQYYIFSHL